MTNGAIPGLTADDQAAFEAMERGEPLPEVEAEVGEQTDAEEGGPSIEPEDLEIEPPKAGDRPKMVPHGALHAEREKRKALEAERTALIEARAREQERLAILMQAVQQQQAPQTPPQAPPDPDEDIFAYAKWQQQQLQDMQQRMAAEQQQRAAVEQQRAAVTHVYTQTQTLEAQFREQRPDYDQAIKHLGDSRRTELERMLTAMGTPSETARAQAAQQVTIEAQQLAVTALRQGRNPAEVAYEIAQARGYQPGAPSSGAAQKLDMVAKGQSVNKSLSSASGSAKSEVTLESLGSMTDAEFARYVSSVKGGADALLKRAMGG